MYSTSRASSESESSSDRSVDSGIGCLLATEGIVSVDCAARYLSNFAGELQKQKVHRRIGKDIRSGKILRDGYGTRVRGRAWRERPRGDVSTDIGRRIILVLTEAGSQT